MDNRIEHPPEDAAAAASLRYVNDGEAGFSRHRSGKRFRYRNASGKWLTEAAAIDRIDALAIPPAWTDVWICRDAKGHIQATGRDQRGRKQYRYHPKWSENRGQAKFASLAAFAKALPRLRKRINRDLGRRGLPRDKVLAAIVWLLDNAMIRIGNAMYARDNGSFGLTTLRNRHVEIEGSKLKFAFKGKSGKEWLVKLNDRRMSRVIRQIQELPGQSLFQYVGDDGQRAAVNSDEVNDYIREAAGGQFSSKDFRTWGGTVRALTLFADCPLPEGKRAAARVSNEVIDQVALRLGNTRAVCRKGYIHPGVIESWSAGKLQSQIASIRSRGNQWMDVEETVAARWLARTETHQR
ncbi:DNA topoisomerase IB [Aminobacter ciceronei]|uniref:DNA topoisomerase IB n=1 Tax=Aminobacter ciceronei TaxID=150723 RepID=UPI003F71E56F